MLHHAAFHLLHREIHDLSVHHNLRSHVFVVVAGVIDEDRSHQCEDVLFTLVIDRYSRDLSKFFSDPAIDDGRVEPRKVERVQWRRSLTNRLETAHLYFWLRN